MSIILFLLISLFVLAGQGAAQTLPAELMIRYAD